MRLFACKGRSASLIQNHSEVKVTPATIMPFRFKYGVVSSPRTWVSLLFWDFITKFWEETENFTKCCDRNLLKFLQNA